MSYGMIYAALLEHVLQRLDKLQDTKLVELSLLFSNLRLAVDASKEFTGMVSRARSEWW